MSEQSTQTNTSKSRNDVQTDWFLQSLSNLTNTAGITFSITLSINGQTISGTLIGGKEYFEKFAESFSTAWPLDNKEEIEKSFSKPAELYQIKDGKDELSTTDYIHLKDAQIQSGNNICHSNLWRGKVSSVCGFSLGSTS